MPRAISDPVKGTPARLVLLGKPACHLCEEMREVVEEVLPGWHAVLEERDIREDPELSRRWAYEIPVLFLGEVEVARHRLSGGQLEDALRRAGVPRAVRPLA